MTVVTPTNHKGTQIFFESHSNQTITMKKIAFITGATSGIGQACAQKFAASGYNLIINGRNTDKLNEMSEMLTQSGIEVLTLPFDVRDREATPNAIESLVSPWNQIDVLVNAQEQDSLLILLLFCCGSIEMSHNLDGLLDRLCRASDIDTTVMRTEKRDRVVDG